MTQFLKLFLSLFCLLMLAGTAVSAQTNAAARFDSSVVETGETFTLHLIVPGRTGQPEGVDWTAWQSVFPDSNRLSQTGWKFNAGVGIWTNDVSLITFDSANLNLPPLSILLKGNRKAQTNPAQLRVIPTPSPNDVVDMADIKDIQREPSRLMDYLMWMLIGGGVVFLIVLYFWWQARKKRAGALSRMLALTPDQLALKQLDALAQKRLWQKGQVKAYYDELSFIVREYLEKAFHAPALESTTKEIVVYLAAAGWPEHLYRLMEEMLRQADLAKFAKTSPPETFHERALEIAREFVTASRAHQARLHAGNGQPKAVGEAQHAAV